MNRSKYYSIGFEPANHYDGYPEAICDTSASFNNQKAFLSSLQTTDNTIMEYTGSGGPGSSRASHATASWYLAGAVGFLGKETFDRKDKNVWTIDESKNIVREQEGL